MDSTRARLEFLTSRNELLVIQLEKLVGNSVKLGMSIPAAYKTTLSTWASWVENTIDANRTLVLFRTFEPSHWSEKSRRFCNVTQNPLSETEGRDQSIFSETVFDVVKNMTVTVHITILQVTSLSAFRKDAHVGGWSDNPLVLDCSHWCLPGLPDVWNEIFLLYLLADYGLPAGNGKQVEFISFLVSLLSVVIFYTAQFDIYLLR
ncbi:Protein trichome berefringence-like 7 [Hibiscus syriacus]|uniref:Protein trichome berefringence-like 7 n=1 Tax=Hibiscus syriacus TaxID=106335 RepID=A0A6A2WX11_HIBSY|nr:Protein trichome berefringence-like 7 [Hibiscus syriacus]